MNSFELFEYIKLSSIPLRKLDRNGMPTGSASGCLIDYRQRRILLTVQHAVGDMGNWTVEVKYKRGKGTLSYPLEAVNFLVSISLDDFGLKDIDFAYIFVPNDFNSIFQEIWPNGQIISETPRKICRVSFNSEPSGLDSYGFSGQVLTCLDGSHLGGEHKVYRGLKFVEANGDFYIFELPMRHPGHEYFLGCSGAPIIDSQGNAVALVCQGEVDKNRIWGISLKKYQVAIDVTIDDLVRNT